MKFYKNFIILFLVLILGYLFFPSKAATQIVNDKADNNIDSEVVLDYATTNDLNDTQDNVDFYLYENADFGISLNLPKKFYNSIYNCFENKDGDLVFEPQMDDLVVYDLPGGLFLSGTQQYTKHKTDDGFECKELNLEELNERTAFFIKKTVVKNESDINQFLSEVYGEECKLDELIALDQDEVYSLRFSGLDGVFGPDNGCFTNWAFRNFYNKKTGEIVYWDIGQDIVFLKGDDFSSGYDNEISDSLKFLR